MSITYFTKAGSVDAHVSEGNVPLPVRSVPRRCTGTKTRPQAPALSQPEPPAPDLPTCVPPKKKWRRLTSKTNDQDLTPASRAALPPASHAGSQPTVSTAAHAQEDWMKVQEELHTEKSLPCAPFLKKCLHHINAVRALPYGQDFYESLPEDLKSLVEFASQASGSQPTA